MKIRLTLRECAISLLVLLTEVAAIASDVGKTTYSVTDLGSLGSTFVSAFAVNNRGEAAGRLEPSLHLSHAFIYRHNQLLDLGTLPGKLNSRAQGINEAGQAVGWSYSRSNQTDAHAFLYDTVMRDMHPQVTLGGSASYASAITNAGHIVGDSYTANDAEDHAFLFSHGASMDLGTLGGTGSVADAVNESDRVVGTSLLADGETLHAFMWNGRMHDLGSLGGSYSEATAINDQGDAVGVSLLAGDATQHAFVCRDGHLQDLHAPSLPANSAAFGVNNRGQIVGTASPTQGDEFAGSIAVLWDRHGAQDLNSLIAPNSRWILYRAAAINASGQIVGVGSHDGQIRAFLLTPRNDD